MLKRNSFDWPTLIIADRGYEAYNLLAHCIEKPNTDFLIRVKQNYSTMREIAKLPMCELDCSIGFTITTTQTNEDKRNHHIFLQVPKKSKPAGRVGIFPAHTRCVCVRPGRADERNLKAKGFVGFTCRVAA